MMAHMMREPIRCSQHDSQANFNQMLQSLSKHAGLQAAFKQQIANSLDAWHDSLNQFFVSCPFLTRLDLSKCAAVVPQEDYNQLALRPQKDGTEHLWSSFGESASAGVEPESIPMIHPCASAVTQQQALPISIKQLLPMLQHLPCLAVLHLCFTKVVCCLKCKISCQQSYITCLRHNPWGSSIYAVGSRSCWTVPNAWH